jgi:iron complex transport system substrate-binding protein
MSALKPFHVVIAVVIVIVLSGLIYFNLENGEDNPSGTSPGNLVVVDSTGKELTIPTGIERVGVVNTFTAEVLRALDVDMSIVVGVSGDFSSGPNSDLWPELSNRRVIQDSAHGEPDIEAMLDLRIEMLITFATHQFVDIQSIRSKLAPAQIVVVGVDLYKYESLYEEIELLGTIFNRTDNAEDLVNELRSIEGMVEQRLSGLDGSEIKEVVIEHHSSTAREPVVRSSQSDWNILLEKCGALNLFEDEPGSVAHIDPEFIIESDPDFFLFDGNLLNLGYGSSDLSDSIAFLESFKERDGYSPMSAVQNDNFLILSGEFSGPMMIHGMAIMAKAFHPDIFEDIDADQMISDYYRLFHGVEPEGTFYYPEV